MTDNGPAAEERLECSIQSIGHRRLMAPGRFTRVPWMRCSQRRIKTYGSWRGSACAEAGAITVLDTTSLVHESYLRVWPRAAQLRVEDRTHFLRYASCAMRSVIVDLVRQRQSERRGGAADHVTLTTRAGAGGQAGERQILRVHEAVGELARHDARMAQVVEMRYFGGLTEAEIAEALDVTDRTVRRDWEKARLWLADALK